MATVNPTEPSAIALRNPEAGSLNGKRSSSIAPSQDLDAPIIPVRHIPYAAAKRITDILISFIALVLAAPALLIVGLLVKLTSRGPIIFKQTRVGAGGKPFTCYKFRSMCQNAETIRTQFLHLNEVSGPVFKIKDDPRMTPIGRFIRKFSLDELPQLVNVLRGEMSIVGPRPPVPNEVATYNARQQRRLSVKPGLTCLWQINGRSNIGFDRWVELDILYIETMSFWNDIKIILKTFPAVITGRGAH
jgi:exopolysaccharide biosynthesis polyprenyl glycosylphosphotransferase